MLLRLLCLGISSAFNDENDSSLHVSTYAATSANRGQATSWKVTQIANPKAIEINSTISSHGFRIAGVGMTQAEEKSSNGDSAKARSGRALSVGAEAATIVSYRQATPPSRACC